jgi:acetyl esterase/lipase
MTKTIGARLLQPINTIFAGRHRIDDVAYGSEPYMTFDEYPVKDLSAPLVIFWHGGSWKTGDKSMYRFVGSKLQSMGLHAFIVDYPKYPRRVYPEFIEDAKKCVEKIQDKYPGRQIVVMGHSAGANTAMLIAMDDKLSVDKAVSISGVCTLNPKYWRPVFGAAIDNKSYDPRKRINRVRTKTSYLLVHGLIDYIVPATDSISLNRMLEESGSPARLILLKFADHILILPTIFVGPRFFTRSKIRKFIFS